VGEFTAASRYSRVGEIWASEAGPKE